METFRISILVARLVGIFLFAALGFGLDAMYRRGIRRYEQVLDDTYTERFMQQTVVAKSVHPHLAQTIRRSKSVVDHVRQSPTDGQGATDALHQVSALLGGTAGESDRTLRSLESGPVTGFYSGYVARGEHVDTKTNSHHDR